MIDKENIGKAIMDMRKKRGLTQAALAELLGVRPNIVWYAETHNGVRSLEMAADVAKVLKFKFDISIVDNE